MKKGTKHSAETRAKMSEAMKTRWARYRHFTGYHPMSDAPDYPVKWRFADLSQEPPEATDYTSKLVLRLPAAALKIVQEMAGGSNKRPTAFARDILYNAIGFQPAAKKEKVFAPEPPCATEKPRGVAGTSYSDADVMELFDRGNSMSAIAAITKIPYRQIAKIIGNQADEMAREAQF